MKKYHELTWAVKCKHAAGRRGMARCLICQNFLKEQSATQSNVMWCCMCRQHGVGSAVQRKKECEYRMGQHVQPSLVLQRLQRHNSL